MPINAIENLAPPQPQATKTLSQPDAMRRAARQFEAILLTQLTSAMNSTGEINSDGDEDSLFGNDGGSDLAKKMFSEQMATTMSENGGVGLADLIMQKFGATEGKTSPGKIKNLSNAISAVKEIKEISATNETCETILPLSKSTGGSEDAIDSLAFDRKILNSTRPRIVPESMLSGNSSFSADSALPTLKPGEKVEFEMPVAGRISSGFGVRFHPIDRRMKFHSGIDIAVPKGTPVGAAAEGVVKFAGWKGGYGYAVVIRHPDGTETLYGHNEKLLVKEGQTVRAGETISLSGSTGKSTGPHLHFEVRQNGRPVDPDKFLSNVLR